MSKANVISIDEFREELSVREIRDTTANPAPLGLLGFGLTTICLNLHNAGFYPIDTMILGMGIFYGGIAQVIAGVMEWKKNNTFGTTAFTSYGLFWLSLCGILIMPKLGIGQGPNTAALVTYLSLWGAFTAVLWLCTFKMNRALQVIFGLLTALFFLLAAGDAMESSMLKLVAGFEGILCGASAVYAGLAQVVNEVYGMTLLPLGTGKGKAH